MSLFLGKDTNGNNILHITSEVTEQALMKSPDSIPASCFHSSMKYLTYNKIDIPTISGTLTYNGFNGALLYSKDETGYFIHFNSSLISNIVTNKLVFLVLLGDYIVANGSSIITDNAKIVFTDSTSKGANKASNVSESNPYMFIATALSVSSCSILLLNVKSDTGYVPPSIDISKGIVLNSNQFIINNINLLDFKYISNVKINNVDRVATTLNGDIQLINSSSPSGNLTLESNSNYSRIASNSNTIFTSEYGLAKLIYNSAFTSTLPSITISGGTTKDILLESSIVNGFYCLTAAIVNSTPPAITVLYENTDLTITVDRAVYLGDSFSLKFILTSSGIVFRYDLSNVDSGSSITFDTINITLSSFI